MVIKNPCVDPTLTSIEGDNLVPLTYTIATEMMTYTAHEDYRVVTDPAEHGLCGEVVSLGFYDDSLANGKPLTYDATN